MLTCSDLLQHDSYSQISDISLELYRDFSRNVLLKRSLHYYFTDGTDITVKFREFGIRHMLGIQHIDGSTSREHFLTDIDNGLSLASFNANASIRQRYKKMKPRIRFFSCVYHTLRCGRVFYFPDQSVPNTNDVRLDYIVYREIDGKGLNIGMRFEQGSQVPISILVDNGEHKEEHINHDNQKIVYRLIISEIDSGTVIEDINYSDSFIMSDGVY